MKKLLIAAASATLLSAPSVFAQAQNFQGLGTSLSINSARSKIDIYSSALADNAAQSSINYIFQGQYLWTLGSWGLIGGGISFDSGELKASYSPTREAKLRDGATIFAKFGVAQTDDLMLFTKLAYATATADYMSEKIPLQGIGLGIGAQYRIDKNWYARAEWLAKRYEEKAIITNSESIRFSTSGVSVGVGYKF